MVISPRTVILQLSILAAVHAVSNGSPEISWNPCNETEFPSAIPNDCGTLKVPRDYSNPDSKPLALELLRVPALSQPSNGSILFNFGGPGQPARSALSGLGPILQQLTGTQYDLIAFDPRGTGNTLPFSCYTNELDTLTYMLDRTPANASDTTLGKVWARGDVNANHCLKNANDTISLVSSTFVARDLISVVDALDEDGLLRYWGSSYGTTLGVTVASMFPDRIDKMILDGVQNPHEYYNGVADIEEWTDSDKVFSGLFSSCIDAGDRCSLTQLNQTAAELEQSVWDLIDTIKFQPLSLGDFILDYNEVKGAIAAAFYTTDYWPNLADQLTVLLSGKAEDHPELFDSGGAAGQLGHSTLTESLAAIHCVDRKVRASFSEYSAATKQLYSTSRFYGDLNSALTADCARWKVEPKESFQGDLRDIKTKEPVLIIGNTFDGQTSIVSAHNISSSFPDSVVLEVNGYGHGSLALPSACTLKEVSTYWTDGKLPEKGKVCEIDALPYMNRTWADVLEELSDGGGGGGGGGKVKREAYEAPRTFGRRW